MPRAEARGEKVTLEAEARGGNDLNRSDDDGYGKG